MAVPRRTSHELDNLAGLLADFGAGGWTPDRADEAFVEIAERSRQIESFFEQDARIVSDLSTGPGSLTLWGVLEVVGRSIHDYLFTGILTTAGRYRRPDDPDSGFVGFGGLQHQTTQPAFRGTPPRDLSEAVDRAYARLVDARARAWSDDPAVRTEARSGATSAAVLFYKDLSGVHPFYDANGRVGRYVVSVYLLLHGRYVRWDEVDQKETKFLKRINECLKRRGHTDARAVNEYEGYLVDFWRPFVRDLPDEPRV